MDRQTIIELSYWSLNCLMLRFDGSTLMADGVIGIT
jgi:hypothetical protein